MDDYQTVRSIMNDPLFDDFGQFLFPMHERINNQMTINDIDTLLPYHTNIKSETTKEVIDYMRDKRQNNEVIFYDIYSEEEKEKDVTKQQTGLFFFKGNKNADTAIISAGGGFVYVGSIHESFPHALELSKQGYNAFALQYRVTSSQDACDDLAAAIAFLFEHQEELEISMDHYSLWGGSAGARMAAYLGSYGTGAFQQKTYPRASTIVMQYTGHRDYNASDPATYVCVGEDDGIAPWRIMKQRIDSLNALGVPTEFHKYPNVAHGFGLGVNTSAEGWINDAIAFWQKQGGTK